jgi:ribosomal protein S18 acetylase RimI-like enzyme
MGPVEQNQDVVMEARPLRRQACLVPPCYSLRAFESRDVCAWTAIQAAADRYNVITDTLFEAAFGSDPSLHRARIFMACDEHGTPVGTAAAWFGEGEDRAAGRVHWVAVLPAHQGRGLGRALVCHAVNRLVELGHTEAYLTTSAARLAALHLYDACGFRGRLESRADRVAWEAIARVLIDRGRPLVHRVL